MNIKDNNAVVEIDGTFMSENIQRTRGEQFQRQGDFLCFFFGLFQQFVSQVAESSGRAVCLCLLIHKGGAAVDNGFLLRANACFINLLYKGHDKLRFLHNGIVLAVAVYHIHCVQAILAACRHMNNGCRFLAQSRRQCAELVFRVADQHIVLGVENQKSDKLFCGKGFARTGNAQQESRLIEKICFVAHNEIVRDGVFSEINTALVLHLLYLERHKHRKAFGSESTKRIDFSCTDRENRIQAVELLELQNGKLAHMLSCNGQHRFGVAVKLFLIVCGNYHRNHRKHHALIPRCQVVQKFLCFFSLQFHIIRHDRRKIIVGVLPALPVGDVRVNAEQTVFHLPHRLVGGNGDNINRQHHIAVKVGELRYHAVLDIAGVVFQKKNPAIFLAELQIIAILFNGIGADIIFEIVPLFHHILRVEMKRRFLSLTVEVVEDAQLFPGVQFAAF